MADPHDDGCRCQGCCAAKFKKLDPATFGKAPATEPPTCQPLELRELFRASIREDLSRVLAEIDASHEPDASDELRALAEEVCAASQEDESPEAIRQWALELSIGLAATDVQLRSPWWT